VKVTETERIKNPFWYCRLQELKKYDYVGKYGSTKFHENRLTASIFQTGEGKTDT
jgi:hypothetical protein